MDTFYSEILDETFKVPVSRKAQRTIDKYGGLDGYVLNFSPKKVGGCVGCARRPPSWRGTGDPPVSSRCHCRMHCVVKQADSAFVDTLRERLLDKLAEAGTPAPPRRCPRYFSIWRRSGLRNPFYLAGGGDKRVRAAAAKRQQSGSPGARADADALD